VFRDLGDGAVGIVCEGFEKVSGGDLVCLQPKVYLKGGLGEDRREVDVRMSHRVWFLPIPVLRDSIRVGHVMNRMAPVDRVPILIAA